MENENIVLDLNSIPDPLDPKELINMMRQHPAIPIDSTVYNSSTVTPASYAQGMWSQITQTNTYYDPKNRHKTISQRLDELELANRLLKVEIQVLKGKFTEEEGNNIKAMLTSNDESSITVAELILENA